MQTTVGTTVVMIPIATKLWERFVLRTIQSGESGQRQDLFFSLCGEDFMKLHVGLRRKAECLMEEVRL